MLKIQLNITHHRWKNLGLNDRRKSAEANTLVTQILELSDKDFKAVTM